MAISYSGDPERYMREMQRKMEEKMWHMERMNNAVGVPQQEAKPAPKPEVPKHLNPKLLLTKGV